MQPVLLVQDTSQCGSGQLPGWQLQWQRGVSQMLWQSSWHCVLQAGFAQTVRHLLQSALRQGSAGQTMAHLGASQRDSQCWAAVLQTVSQRATSQTGLHTSSQVLWGPQFHVH